MSIQQSLVVFAKNKKRVSAFYRQTLGWSLPLPSVQRASTRR
jgi:hypothetical protein